MTHQNLCLGKYWNLIALSHLVSHNKKILLRFLSHDQLTTATASSLTCEAWEENISFLRLKVSKGTYVLFWSHSLEKTSLACSFFGNEVTNHGDSCPCLGVKRTSIGTKKGMRDHCARSWVAWRQLENISRNQLLQLIKYRSITLARG